MKTFLSSLLALFLSAGTAEAQSPISDIPVPTPAERGMENAGRGAVEGVDAVIAAARALEPIHTLIVARDGKVLIEEAFDGFSTTTPANIKSASKSIVSALVGIAIERGDLEGVDQKIAPILSDKLPDDPDPRIHDITIGNLLSMQAGLGRTSGPNYGRWIASDDWVAAALAQPFADDPGGRMLYSTGSTHLLSAILERVTGEDTMMLANEWLSLGGDFRVADWERDPQGIPLGGNQMAVSPRALLAFGELYRQGGIYEGERVLPESWIEQSWEPRTRSVFSGERYGYNWFITELAGYDCYYAWGYGGQMLYILPEIDLTVVITSDAEQPSARSGYNDRLHGFVAETIVPFAISHTDAASIDDGRRI
jgi:CubicO group peptidase (beta-lactamase class C family)